MPAIEYVFLPPDTPSVGITGTAQRFPVRRIYCVGRNYAEHVREMGSAASEPPIFFAKPADAIVANGATVPFPPATDNFHYEVELVVAMGGAARNIPAAQALGHVFGYATGNDLTRRDRQQEAKQKGMPWEIAKSFDASAPVSNIRPASLGHVESGRIWLSVNGEVRQDSNVAQMIWKVPQIIAHLSTLYELKAGDLIYTGTPAGVGPLERGDKIECGVDGLDVLRNTIGGK